MASSKAPTPDLAVTSAGMDEHSQSLARAELNRWRERHRSDKRLDRDLDDRREDDIAEADHKTAEEKRLREIRDSKDLRAILMAEQRSEAERMAVRARAAAARRNLFFATLWAMPMQHFQSRMIQHMQYVADLMEQHRQIKASAEFLNRLIDRDADRTVTLTRDSASRVFDGDRDILDELAGEFGKSGKKAGFFKAGIARFQAPEIHIDTVDDALIGLDEMPDLDDIEAVLDELDEQAARAAKELEKARAELMRKLGDESTPYFQMIQTFLDEGHGGLFGRIAGGAATAEDIALADAEIKRIDGLYDDVITMSLAFGALAEKAPRALDRLSPESKRILDAIENPDSFAATPDELAKSKIELKSASKMASMMIKAARISEATAKQVLVDEPKPVSDQDLKGLLGSFRERQKVPAGPAFGR